MGCSVLCTCIDDCTVEFTSNEVTVVVAMQDGLVYIINPFIDVDGCPLVTYWSW